MLVHLVNILPRSIRKVTLRHCSMDMVQQLDEFLEQRSERLPALEPVIIIAEREWGARDFTPKQEMITLKEKALEYGITLVLPMHWSKH